MDKYLKPTFFIDSDSSEIKSISKEFLNHKDAPVKIFYFVRDRIKYNPYSPFEDKKDYVASTILKRGYGYCIQKAVLLCAIMRACSIPSRLVFVDIKNHKAPEKLKEFFGNLFIYHGYCEAYINSKWIKLTPTFNIEMCEKFGYTPTEFNGKDDAMLQKYSREGELIFEYVNERGTFYDLPFDEIISAYKNQLGKEKLEKWRKLVYERG